MPLVDDRDILEFRERQRQTNCLMIDQWSVAWLHPSETRCTLCTLAHPIAHLCDYVRQMYLETDIIWNWGQLQ